MLHSGMTEARSFTSVVFATDGKRMVNLYRNPVPCYDVATNTGVAVTQGATSTLQLR